MFRFFQFILFLCFLPLNGKEVILLRNGNLLIDALGDDVVQHDIQLGELSISNHLLINHLDGTVTIAIASVDSPYLLSVIKNDLEGNWQANNITTKPDLVSHPLYDKSTGSFCWVSYFDADGNPLDRPVLRSKDPDIVHSITNLIYSPNPAVAMHFGLYSERLSDLTAMSKRVANKPLGALGIQEWILISKSDKSDCYVRTLKEANPTQRNAVSYALKTTETGEIISFNLPNTATLIRHDHESLLFRDFILSGPQTREYTGEWHIFRLDTRNLFSISGPKSMVYLGSSNKKMIFYDVKEKAFLKLSLNAGKGFSFNEIETSLSTPLADIPLLIFPLQYPSL